MSSDVRRSNGSRRRFAGFLRGAFWVVVGATILRVWFGASPSLSSAEAQIPDAGKQRLTLLKEAKRSNQLLSDIKGLLEGGTLNVRVVGADN